MKFDLKTRFSLLVISAVIFTALTTAVAFGVVIYQQSRDEHIKKLEIAQAGFNERFAKLQKNLQEQFNVVQNNRKLNNNFYYIVTGNLLEFHMFPEIENLAHTLGVDQFGFYAKVPGSNRPQLLLYYSKKLGGNVSVKNGQHRLYQNNNFGSQLITDPGLLPRLMPKRKDTFVRINDRLYFQHWNEYYSLTYKENLDNNIIGYFVLYKALDFNLARLASEIGVDFTLYDLQGKVIYSRNNMSDLQLGDSLLRHYTRNVDSNGNQYDSVISPIQTNQHFVGYFSVDIPVQITHNKIINVIKLVIIISLLVVIIVLLVSHFFIRQIISPIQELTRVTRSIAGGQLDQEINVTTHDELGILASNFIRMQDSIKAQITELNSHIEERKQAEKEIRTLSQAVEQSPVSVLITDLEGNIEYVNHAFEMVTGYTLNEVIGKNPRILSSGHTPYSVYVDMWDTITSGQAWSGELQNIKKNGEPFWEYAYIAPVYDDQGSVHKFLGIKEDISLRKQHEDEILRQARFDDLTGLPNRSYSLERLELMLSEVQRSDAMIAVLFVDLDDFKKINDSLGHETGDNLLIEAAKRLKRVIRPSDMVGRLGGDEFIVLVGPLEAAAGAAVVAEHLLNEFRDVFVIENRELLMTASIGISLYPNDANSPSELLRKADTAMYSSKGQGRNIYSFYNEQMNHEVLRQLSLEEQMHGALERGEFEVYYQSKNNINTGHCIGAEALIRWNNPVLGQVSPAEFIPVAERTGQIIAIGKFVLKQALGILSRKPDLVRANISIAINLSPRQFHDKGLVAFIDSLFNDMNVPRKLLELEITEGVLMSGHGFVNESLQQLGESGIQIAMDDFGTGYSSLSYLRQYPFNILKIDQSFIKDITIDPADKELINATIVMAHSLDLKVVAEGVETREQLDMLRLLNCDMAQGYYFSKPAPEDEWYQQLQRHAV